MKRVVISVEGKTELLFIKAVLYPYLLDKKILVSPVPLYGYRTYNCIKKEILNLGKGKDCIITTMYDFYGLSKINDFAGINFNDFKTINCIDKVKNIESSFSDDINLHNFIPYIQLHEFETFIFVDSSITANNLQKCNKINIINYIDCTKKEFDNNPELINDSIKTAPSKRIESQYTKYEKTTDGINITIELGIQKIIDTCPHFKEWIEKIENFGE